MKKSKIRELRENLELSYPEIERRSAVIAKREKDKAYIVSRSRMQQIEKGSQPGFHKMVSLAEILHLTTMKLQKVIKESK